MPIGHWTSLPVAPADSKKWKSENLVITKCIAAVYFTAASPRGPLLKTIPAELMQLRVTETMTQYRRFCWYYAFDRVEWTEFYYNFKGKINVAVPNSY